MEENSREGESGWVIISHFRNELFGIAILSIIIFHYFENVLSGRMDKMIGTIPFFYNKVFGSIGVEIFLLLSGMGLCFSMKKNSSVKNFYKKRMKRVLIPYFICSLFFWLIRDFIINRNGMVDFLMDFSLLSFWTKGTKTLWFIAFLIPAYVIYPFIYKCMSGKRKKRFIFLLVIETAVIAIIQLIKNNSAVFFRNTEIALYRIPIFIYGAYLGERVYAKDRFKVFDYVLFAAGIICKTWNVLFAYKLVPLPCPIDEGLVNDMFGVVLTIMLAYIIKMINVDSIRSFLRYVGSCSLELFLTHVTIRSLMNMSGYRTRFLSNYCICIALSLFCVILLKRVISSSENNIIIKSVSEKDLQNMADK